ncbi:hypothetical protein X801_05126 [Opisthorchis viverrini]|uniref:GTP-eEF1A C-terminal domain-containing protein n=1 Tax=Opisthorchis viverrini TaxID=6198 RepID=A0A1S8WX97_OPIVI|nr:hypothetical protein X801_05126 [Opisthorchis viverrini]
MSNGKRVHANARKTLLLGKSCKSVTGSIAKDSSVHARVSDRFDAKLIVLDCKSIMCPGYTAVLHMHSTMKEVRLRTIICRIDKKTNQKTEIRPRFIKQDDAAVVRFEIFRF